MRKIVTADGEIVELPVVRTRFNYSMDLVSEHTGLSCPEPTRTQQNFKEECDINTIVRRFGITGQLPENLRMPQYIDYEGVFDFQSAMNAVLDAEAAFMTIPAEIRARFQNDPQQFLEFCSRPENHAEAVKLGLATPPAAPPAEPPKGGDQLST